MSTAESGQPISPTSEELTLENTRLRQQLADIDEKLDDRVSAAVAEATAGFRSEATEQERRQYRAEMDTLTAQNAALTRDLQQHRSDADHAARERMRSRFSALHTPTPARAIPQSSPITTRAIPQSSPTGLNFGAQSQSAIAPATTAPRTTIRYPQPPMFSATRKKDQMAFRVWQYAFLNYCDANGLDTQTNAEQCIVTAAALFAPDVAFWYRTEYLPAIKPSPPTWEFFIQCLIDKYEPVPVGFTARTALKSIRQTGTIEEYNATFNEVVTLITDMSEADKVDKYIDGLKQALRVKVASTLTKTLIESMTVAVQLEAAWATTRDRNPPAVYNRNNRGPPPIAVARNDTTVYAPPMQLGNMSLHDEKNNNGDYEEKSAPSHVLAVIQPQRGPLPKLSDAERARLSAIGGCFKCRRTGHMARDCPDKSKNY